MLTLFLGPDKGPRVSCMCWEKSIIHFSIHLHSIPLCSSYSSGFWGRNMATAPAALLFQRKGIFWRMCAGKESLSPAWAGFICCALASMFGVWLPWHWSLGSAVWRGGDSEVFRGLWNGPQWTHSNGKSGLLIHTLRLLWRAAEQSLRRRQRQTAAQQTPDGYISKHVNFFLISLVIPLEFDRTNGSRWSRRCSSVDWTHLFSPKAWHCISSHTHLCMHKYNNEHMLSPSPEAQPQAVGPESQPFSLQHYLTCK